MDGAVTFRGPDDVPAVRRMVRRIVQGGRRGLHTRLAFVVPPGAVWPLPAYELALQTDRLLRRRGVRDARLADPRHRGGRAAGGLRHATSEAVADDLVRAGIALRAGAIVRDWSWGRLELRPRGHVAVDRVVALPLQRGPAIPGLPCDAQGFVRAGADGRVAGRPDVFVVGDAGSFAVKQGGIACQQADAVARLIAHELGAPVAPIPFEPVLRGWLWDGDGGRFMRADLAGGRSESAGVTSRRAPLWSPAGEGRVPLPRRRPSAASRLAGAPGGPDRRRGGALALSRGSGRGGSRSLSSSAALGARSGGGPGAPSRGRGRRRRRRSRRASRGRRARGGPRRPAGRCRRRRRTGRRPWAASPRAGAGSRRGRRPPAPAASDRRPRRSRRWAASTRTSRPRGDAGASRRGRRGARRRAMGADREGLVQGEVRRGALLDEARDRAVRGGHGSPSVVWTVRRQRRARAARRRRRSPRGGCGCRSCRPRVFPEEAARGGATVTPVTSCAQPRCGSPSRASPATRP